MAQAFEGKLEKLDEFRWKIPQSYKPGMKVPGIIYANDKLFPEIINDKAPEQVANVAFLPGIVKYSLAMPDIHWGYGMAIGGVAAVDPDKSGVVAPGAIGYDICCLSEDALILNELGYSIKIKDFKNNFQKTQIKCLNFTTEKEEPTEIIGFLKQKPKHTVLDIVTETLRRITATEDHPFYTKDGMKPVSRLKLYEEVAVYPFEGVKYEAPSSDIIADKEGIKKLLLNLGKSSKGNAIEQILNQLEKRNLLPLRYDSSQFPCLLKIMGYCFGDGLIYFVNKKEKGNTCFYGEEEDLIKIKSDIEKIGFKTGIYSRNKRHHIDTSYSTYEFDRKETWLKVASSSFAVLLASLGMPIGNKCRQPYEFPKWLFSAPLWQKRLFLAGFFGAEMSSPKTLTGHGYNFYCPTVSMNKTYGDIENGRKFLEDIGILLSDFGVRTHQISQRKEYVNKEGIVSYRLRLMISSETQNLLKLYSRIGFEYNEKRKFLANAAAGYLRSKDRITAQRREVVTMAPKLKLNSKWSPEAIYNAFSSERISKRFIERSLYGLIEREPRMWGKDPTFEDYIEKATYGLGKSGMVWERIEHICNAEYGDWVYDFTVAHPHHNFIANNFVVSNCGVRLLRSDLVLQDVKPRLEQLVNSLFNNIPSGIGSSGDIRANARDEDEIFLKGAEWAVKKGYGVKEDLEFTEDNGCMEGANPQGVSKRAYERGKDQSGTLGSGNHFLEIQVVDEIYDEKNAGIFDLFKGQVTMMIHSGSRGLGYQICDDYVKGMMSCLDKYNINVPDRQLACAPLNSPEGKAYLAAMKCAANYAWTNRQCLMHLARNVFEKVFNKSWSSLGLRLVYDVAHNIAKMERHIVDSREKLLCVHRKGATRAFPPGHPDLPKAYKETGQPVIIPGDMGRNSFLLAGAKGASETFCSTCHGAGRRLSRSGAIKACHGRQIDRELFQKSGIIVRAKSRGTLAEEAPEAYKDVNEVVDVVHGAGLSTKVCRMRPLGVIKG
ncbi:MAG: intein-containing RctB family protein [Candidatus Omnitrophota bacterium]|nr:intein-containing RctB family protein [Candidatus Omnitrophota bacterium]